MLEPVSHTHFSLVGTCSLQSGELLPDAPCYDNCRDTPEQRHFLTCIENTCLCRKAGHASEGPPPQQAAVPLNAGGVVEGPGQNSTDNSTAAPTSSPGNSSTVSAEGTSTVSQSVTDGNNVTSSNVTQKDAPSNVTQKEDNMSSVTPTDPASASVTPK